MHKINPYKECPILKSKRFIYRQVRVDDAEDLLECYSDRKSVKIFNSDNCPIDFYFDDQKELSKLIDFWLKEYSYGGYVRFAVVNMTSQKAIGTIEIFAKKEKYEKYGSIGVLRLDLSSKYENEESITDIMEMIEEYFGKIFGIDSIITKAVPYAKERVEILMKRDYTLLTNSDVTKYDNYYIKHIGT